MMVPPFRVGVDVGGTFTDLVLVDGKGSTQAFKAPSVSSDPTAGVLAAISLAADAVGTSVETFMKNTSLLIHGSTVATNTLLEKKGAKVGLLTTAGFRDGLEIRRGFRRDVWDHREPYPEVLVPRHLRLPVTERMNVDGSARVALDEASVVSAAQALAKSEVNAIAISFLHSYRNPAHERAAKEILRRVIPGIWVTTSSEVAPIIGEYERTSTTVINAYVATRVVPYLKELDRRLSALGLSRGVLMIQSNGGAISVSEIDHAPVRLVLSGPAAGVGALNFFGRDTGSDSLMAIEVGGTSCDVTIMENSNVGMTDQLEIDGYHIAIPAVDINTVGAGGGTIASVDKGGLLRAGPEGAGSMPGPASYGRGGERPTVTDAQLVLGRLKAGPYAGGAISLDLDKAIAAVTTHVAEPLGISVTAAAAGIIKLVEQNIVHAVEQATVERGYDPRRFTLVAAGGAGPLHGASVARLLNCSAMYMPRLAGVFCAFGMCNTDLRHDYVESWLQDLDDNRSCSAELEKGFDRIRAKAEEALKREGFATTSIEVTRMYDMRYFGQQWTVPVECESTKAADVRAAFEVVYRRLFGYVQEGGQIEVVNLRLSAVGKLPPLTLNPAATSADAPQPISRRRVWVDEKTGYAELPIYSGADLTPGHTLQGPAVIEEATTTLFVGAGDNLKITAADNYHVEIGTQASP